MPIKRPDQLPSGSSFSFDDILLVEKDPNSDGKVLFKATLRDFMKSALQLDPERMGANPIIGLQSKFEWVVDQVEALGKNPLYPVSSYEGYVSDGKSSDDQYTSPTPTSTVTPTVTPSSTPFKSPTPTPTLTPSITPSPNTSEKQITLKGYLNETILLPQEHLPKNNGYSEWEIKEGSVEVGLSTYFEGVKPDSYSPTQLGEKLFTFKRLNEGEDFVFLNVVYDEDDHKKIFVQGLERESSITFTIKYS